MKSLSDVQQEYLTGVFGLVVPEAILVGTACVLLLLGLFLPRRLPAVLLALVGVAGAAVAAALLGGQEVASFWQVVEGTAIDPRTIAPFDPTGLAPFVRWLMLGAAAVFVLQCWPEVRGENAADYAACTLVMAAGASLVARANDLVSLFVALEMVSIPTYVLLYLPIRNRSGLEAAVKYFLLSVLSSAVLLFGFSYLYGLTGTTNLGAIVATLTAAHQQAISPMALVAIMLVIAALGFRVTAFPFHWYAPDVYEAAPTGVVAQVAFVPKVVGFVALARLLGLLAPPLTALPFDAVRSLVPLMLWIIAAATMTFGNVLALLQDNLKRLLAYSGIAHGGYMLIGLVVALTLPETQGRAPSQNGLDALLVYLVAYGLMTVGAFALLLHLSGPEGRVQTVDDLGGLGQTHPVSAATLAVLLFSLIGLPLTAGFVGKFLLFISAFDAPDTGPMQNMYRILAVIAAINAAIGAVYYLRILGVMYLRSPLHEPAAPRGRPALAAAAVCAAATLILGIYPKPLVEAAKQATPIVADRPASGEVAAVK